MHKLGDVDFDDKTQAFLDKNHSAGMVTLRADGTPHVVRVGVALVDGKLWSSGTPDQFRKAMIDEQRVIYEFAPVRVYGL